MAWIEKVGHHYRVGWMDPATKRQRYRGGFGSRSDASRFARDVETGDRVPSDLTLDSYAARVFDSSMDLRGSTLYAYQTTWNRHVSLSIGRKRLDELTTQDMRDFFRRLDVGDIGPSARASVYRVLAKILNSAVREGVLSRSPLSTIKKPRDERRRDIVPQPIDRLEAFAAAVDPRFRLAVLLAGYGGLRGGEVGGLRLQDVDFEKSQGKIVQATARYGGQRVLTDVKTAASRRRIDVPRFLMEEVFAHVERFGVAPDGRLFQAASGGLVVNQTLDGALKAAWRKIHRGGEDDLDGENAPRFHDLRHTCAALMVEQGAHPKTIQAHMGHSSIGVTLDVYGHLFPGLGRSVADSLDRQRKRVVDSA